MEKIKGSNLNLSKADPLKAPTKGPDTLLTRLWIDRPDSDATRVSAVALAPVIG